MVRKPTILPILACCLGLLIPHQALAAFGFQATDGAFAIINAGSGDIAYRLTPSTGGEDPFHDHDFDDDNVSPDFFNYATNPIILEDLIAHTFEDSGDVVTEVNLFIRAYEIGTTPGSFEAFEMIETFAGAGNRTFGLERPINLTAPVVGNIAGKVVLEMYVQATEFGGGTTDLEGRDGSNPFFAVYSGQAIPEPEVSTLLAMGIIGIRLMVVRARRAKKGEALRNRAGLS